MKPSIKYGLLVSATGILISLLVYVLGMDKTETGQYLGWINVVIMIICMVIGIKETREKFFGGFISFGQAFKVTAVIVLISAVITGIYTYLYMTMINPGMVDYIHEQQYNKMLEKGMPEDQIEAAMKMSEAWTTPGMMSMWAVLGGIVIGLIIGAIISAIVKKPNPNEISQS